MYFHELLLTLIGVASSNLLMSPRAKLLMDPLFLPFPKTSCSLLFALALSLQLLLLSRTSLSFSFNASNNSSFTKCLHHQKSALLEFKHGSFIYRGDYDASSRLDSWNPATDCCSWEGITCDEATGNVIGLDLSNNWRIDERSSRIEGRINSNLFHLNSLQKLNLSWNSFYPNPIPSKLGRLTNLTHLDLSYSWLSGQIPIEILRLKRLVSLNLSQYEWSNKSRSLQLRNPNLTTVVGNLSSLQELQLDGVYISGEYGGKWAQALSLSLPNLHRLSLRYCGLQGPIGSSIFQLPSLSQLTLDANHLSMTVMPNLFSDSSTLTSLSLSGCSLYGKFPLSIFLLPNLQHLDVSNNPKLNIYFQEFPQNIALRNLYLGNTSFHEKLLDSIGNLKSLRKLFLWSCNLSGLLPPIANLTQLEYLVLSSNNLSGTIPLSYQVELQHLIHLGLYNNSLEGSIPLSLFSHPSLKYSDLSNNQFSGWLVDFHNASSSMLEIIYLENNKLHGPIPKSIFQLTNLKWLFLYNNNFTGTIGLDMFPNMKNLSILDLSNNSFSFINNNGSSHLISSSKIWDLSLRSCNISEFPNIIQNLNELRFLDLSNNKIHGEIPNWIWKVGNGSLHQLNLSNNFLESFEHPLPKLSLSRLSIVDLHSNRLQGSLPILSSRLYIHDYSSNSLSFIMPANFNFTSTRFFSLSGNNVSGKIPLSICNAHFLEVLDLSKNNFSGNIPNCLGDTVNSLKILNLRRNALQGIVPEFFKNECGLRTLNLDSNQLEGKLPRSIANCKMLEVLDLGHNHLNDTFPFWFDNLSHLRILILRSNNFHGPIFNSCTDSPLFPVLKIFDLSSNSFKGVVPPRFFLNWKAMRGEDGARLSSNDPIVRHQLDIGSYYQDSVTVTMKGLDWEVVKILTAFASVDLSNNRFQGKIPDSIGNLKSLHVLNLSQNDFDGPILASLENLTELESLDLSKNKLSGNIPWQLTKLTFLAVLNLSHNLLFGSIPQGQQFFTFTNSSFLGNDDLCGLPLSKRCEDAKATTPSIFDNFGFDGDGEIDWKFMWIGFGIGFGVGFGALLWTLALWKKGCRKYMQLIDEMLFLIFFH